MLLIWPTVAVLGFLTLTGLVVALGMSSTARYEFGGNHVRDRQEVTAGAGAAGRPRARGSFSGETDGSAPWPGEPELRDSVTVGMAGHPAGKLAAGRGTAVGWWLVVEAGDPPGDGAGGQVVAGPFPERMEADWAALASGLPASAVYGARRPGQELVRRPAPHERAWLAELGQQLDRLAEDWDPLLSDTNPLATLVVEAAAALVDAGLPLHDCDSRSPGGGSVGGVCLTPAAGSDGIVVTWRQHDRVTLQQVRGAGIDAAVQQTMNAAIAEVLVHVGFAVEPFGPSGCHLVTAG